MKEIARTVLMILKIFVRRFVVFMPTFKTRPLLEEAKNDIISDSQLDSEVDDSELISIIVPIYNVDRYLRRCIESIINQTYKNIEIILVDDGSSDSSPEICDKYKEKDSRIIVIHKENGGLSSARNAGLEVAKGTLIGFVDSDDYIASDMYEKLKANMDKYSSDISACQFCINYKYSKRVSIVCSEEKIFRGKEKFDNLKYIKAVAWNKLYKREIFRKIKYPDGKIYEDHLIICDVLNAAKKVSFINETLYYYTMRRSSITRTFTENHLDQINAFDVDIKYYKKKKYTDLVVGAQYKKVMQTIGYAYKIKAKSLSDKRVAKYVDEAVKLAQKLRNSEYLSGDEKDKLELFLQNGELYYKVLRFRRSIRRYLDRVVYYK